MSALESIPGFADIDQMARRIVGRPLADCTRTDVAQILAAARAEHARLGAAVDQLEARSRDLDNRYEYRLDLEHGDEIVIQRQPRSNGAPDAILIRATDASAAVDALVDLDPAEARTLAAACSRPPDRPRQRPPRPGSSRATRCG
jgi:hypothetical protein